MKRIIMASAAIILLTAGTGAAEAQQWQVQKNEDGRLGPRGGPGGLAETLRQRQQAEQPQQPQQQPPAAPQPQVQAQPQAKPQAPPQQQVQGPPPGGQRGVRVGEPNGRGGGWDNRRDDRRDNRRDRGDRYDRYDRGGWNNGQRHQAGRYYAPRGYGLRIWSYGQILPGAYWGSNYVIRDYWRYGLPRPYAGCQWIRSGDDALMVDRRGRVIEVARNLFW